MQPSHRATGLLILGMVAAALAAQVPSTPTQPIRRLDLRAYRQYDTLNTTAGMLPQEGVQWEGEPLRLSLSLVYWQEHQGRVQEGGQGPLLDFGPSPWWEQLTFSLTGEKGEALRWEGAAFRASRARHKSFKPYPGDPPHPGEPRGVELVSHASSHMDGAPANAMGLGEILRVELEGPSLPPGTYQLNVALQDADRWTTLARISPTPVSFRHEGPKPIAFQVMAGNENQSAELQALLRDLSRSTAFADQQTLLARMSEADAAHGWRWMLELADRSLGRISRQENLGLFSQAQGLLERSTTRGPYEEALLEVLKSLPRLFATQGATLVRVSGGQTGYEVLDAQGRALESQLATQAGVHRCIVRRNLPFPY